MLHLWQVGQWWSSLGYFDCSSNKGNSSSNSNKDSTDSKDFEDLLLEGLRALPLMAWEAQWLSWQGSVGWYTSKGYTYSEDHRPHDACGGSGSRVCVGEETSSTVKQAPGRVKWVF